MNSQDKVTSPQEFYKWAKKRNYSKFLVQYKLDGISIELQFIKAKFQYGVTLHFPFLTLIDNNSIFVLLIKIIKLNRFRQFKKLSGKES